MRTFAFGLAAAIALATQGAAQPASTQKLQGVTHRAPSGTMLRVMLDDSNVGPQSVASR